MRLRLSGMTAGLAIGITAAVVSACAAGAYLYSIHHFESLIDTARSSALAQGELMREALEHQMLENDRTLIGRMVNSFGRQPRVENVMILDRAGAARFSSTPLEPGSDLTIGSPTCQACHQLPPERRSASQVIDTSDGSVLRTVVPVRNRAECHGCHSPEHRINGILILDVNTADMRAAMNSDLWWMVGGSALLALGLISIIALVVRYAVLRRLQRFETTARLIAAGDLERRVPPDGGSDTISWLAQEFNTMADSMTGLVTDVRDQRERLETVINSIDDGIVVLDEKRQVLAANEAFLLRTGCGRREVLGCGCREIAAGMCHSAECPTLSCLQSGERQVRICERVGTDGEIIWEEVHASPIKGPSGGITRVVEVWRDISDRRAAEARLAESHRLASIGVLASGFSHELNTPLATVLTCVEGILRETRGASGGTADLQRVGETATIAREQLLRCRAVTQHFLRMARGQSSSGDLVDVGAAVSAAARLTTPTARAHGVTLDICAPATTHVRVDEAELQHALMNLMLNAVQSCRSGGLVRVSVEDGNPVRILVSDNGCGIQPEHQKRIFEPFFSLRQGGTGLGLFMASNFVRRWGGDIAVASAAGEGSTFEIRLPALAAAGGTIA